MAGQSRSLQVLEAFWQWDCSHCGGFNSMERDRCARSITSRTSMPVFFSLLSPARLLTDSRDDRGVLPGLTNNCMLLELHPESLTAEVANEKLIHWKVDGIVPREALEGHAAAHSRSTGGPSSSTKAIGLTCILCSMHGTDPLRRLGK